MGNKVKMFKFALMALATAIAVAEEKPMQQDLVETEDAPAEQENEQLQDKEESFNGEQDLAELESEESLDAKYRVSRSRRRIYRRPFLHRHYASRKYYRGHGRWLYRRYYRWGKLYLKK